MYFFLFSGMSFIILTYLWNKHFKVSNIVLENSENYLCYPFSSVNNLQEMEETMPPVPPVSVLTEVLKISIKRHPTHNHAQFLFFFIKIQNASILVPPLPEWVLTFCFTLWESEFSSSGSRTCQMLCIQHTKASSRWPE